MKKRLVDIILIFGTFFLIIFSSIIPLVIGNSYMDLDEKQIDYNLYRYAEYPSLECPVNNENVNSKDSFNIDFRTSVTSPAALFDGPMDSSWSTQSHDTHHTGRSPYSTNGNLGNEKWRFVTDSWIEDTPVIDNEGKVYFGCMNWFVYCLYPNGMINWMFRTDGMILGSSPAIDENGTIYIGSWDCKLYAINPDGTEKWSFPSGGSIDSSPAIAEDGTIYFGNFGEKVYAVNPNGTEKWHYILDGDTTCDPVIGDDGTIYIGSFDTYFYALYPNGTLRWRFKTGHYIKGPASIAEDGTIYVGSWDDYLYALYPNGTMKWQYAVAYGTETNPSIASDGTIYVGGWETLWAIYPNGTLRWEFYLGSDRHIHMSSPAISAEGTIYVGTNIGETSGGEIIAVNPDGTERWRKRIANEWVDSSPSIAEDGTVYIGSAYDMGGGYLYAFGWTELVADAHGSYIGIMNEPVQFTGSASGGYPPYSYHWDFGDTETSEEQNPTHEYDTAGNYTVTLTVTDDNDSVAVDTTWALIIEENNPPSAPIITGETEGYYGEEYIYTFVSTDPEDHDVWHYIDWGDETNSGWLGPHSSGQEITMSHTWDEENTYTLRAKAKDTLDVESPWSTLEISMPVNQPIQYPLIQWLLDRFPNVFPMLRQLFEL